MGTLNKVLRFIKSVICDEHGRGSTRRVSAFVGEFAAMYIGFGGEHLFGLKFSDDLRMQLVWAFLIFAASAMGLTLSRAPATTPPPSLNATAP